MPNSSNNYMKSKDFAGALEATGIPPVLPPFDVVQAKPNDGLLEALYQQQRAVEQLKIDETLRRAKAEANRRRKRQLRLCAMLFFLTFASTTLVGADYWPLDLLSGVFDSGTRNDLLAEMNRTYPPEAGEIPTLQQRFWQSIAIGCTYSCPLMLILLCHEMGHFLQAVRNRVPASFPYFIPLPLPPLGTMGAVILQGRGVADRKKMFDIAVSGPLAGLVVTLPILYFGIKSSGYQWPQFGTGFEFGQPYLVSKMIEWIHGPAPMGMVFEWNGWATAGWVGVFITAMNLLPIGQLDGGHLMYTLVGRAAHWIAWGLILSAVAAMLLSEQYSYVLLLVLLMFTGPRHPPTADDTVSLGWFRHLIGWLTLSFLLIGFTPQPILIKERRPSFDPAAILEPLRELSEQEWLQFPDNSGKTDAAEIEAAKSSSE